MDLSNLKASKGATKKKKRIGRGQGSGRGGTSTRGHKGAKSRSGYSRKGGFEGGQMPLQRRIPKFGFKNINRKEYKAVNIGDIQRIAEAESLTSIKIEDLVKYGLIRKNEKAKILGSGKLSIKLDINANAFSKSAKSAIEELGGTANKI